MIYLGKAQDLKVVKFTDFGAYLSALSSPSNKEYETDLSILKEEQVLLPKKELPEGTEQGSILHVFVYKDSEDRPISTTVLPPCTLGRTALLTVSQITDIGAFLDWGLPKELFLPYKEQVYRPAEGDQVLVALYIDKSRRLCATMKIYEYLAASSPHQKGDKVKARIYEIIDAFGAFAAVEDQYSALIPNSELYGNPVKAGDIVEARITGIHEDGRINLSLREKTHIQMDQDAEQILKALKEAADAFLPYHDKSDPEEIKQAFHLSKNAFKRAIGRLMKNGMIAIKEDGIYLVK